LPKRGGLKQERRLGSGQRVDKRGADGVIQNGVGEGIRLRGGSGTIYQSVGEFVQ